MKSALFYELWKKAVILPPFFALSQYNKAC